MLSLVRNTKFKHRYKQFQAQLVNDIQGIQKSKKLLIAADKTTNFYKLDTAVYTKLLDGCVTSTHIKKLYQIW